MPSKATNRFSRYQSIRPTKVQVGDTVREMQPLPETTAATPDGAYTVTIQPGEDLFLMADRLLGNEELWYVLAQLNPHVFYPLDEAVAVEITVPPRSSAVVARFRRQ